MMNGRPQYSIKLSVDEKPKGRNFKNTPTYGYRKVTAILKGRYEIPIGRKRVYSIMKEHKLLLPPIKTNKQLFKGVRKNGLSITMKTVLIKHWVI